MVITENTKWIIFDVESVGLYGKAFAVGGGVFDPMNIATTNISRGNDEFLFFRKWISKDGVTDIQQRKEDIKWLENNIPNLSYDFDPAIRVMSHTYLKQHFLDWLILTTKKYSGSDILIAADCPFPVETNFLSVCLSSHPKQTKLSPYPFIDIASVMLAADIDPMLCHKRTIKELPQHNPLFDARQSARLLGIALLKLKNQHQLGSLIRTLANTIKYDDLLENKI